MGGHTHDLLYLLYFLFCILHAPSPPNPNPMTLHLVLRSCACHNFMPCHNTSHCPPWRPPHHDTLRCLLWLPTLLCTNNSNLCLRTSRLTSCKSLKVPSLTSHLSRELIDVKLSKVSLVVAHSSIIQTEKRPECFWCHSPSTILLEVSRIIFQLTFFFIYNWEPFSHNLLLQMNTRQTSSLILLNYHINSSLYQPKLPWDYEDVK